ncbi:DUF2079 domain-containing protein [Candidatus Roizmanbacteria bacterium]|nr:MAG: DUF2079 domain-containing protein [Candidatus Roizmanbacteria bacterium]
MKKILWFFISVYIIFFSTFSVLRYRNMYANYFDLGIMHHVVYNSYKALQTGDFGRFLEHTDPTGPTQLIRSAVHNDIILALFAPLYFLYPSPEVLLVTQSVVLGLGALAVYGIGMHVLKKITHPELYSLIFAVSYLFYVPLQLANRFDFHSVVLSTSFLLFMFYYWLEKKHSWSLLFLVLSLITKEQVGLTTALFGIYVVLLNLKFKIFNLNSNFKFLISNYKTDKNIRFGLLVSTFSVVWVLFSFFVMIPFFRGEGHFATSRYENINIISTLFRKSTFEYLWNLFAPLGFLSLLSPVILIALPEFAINLLSQEANMRSVVFHYTAVITPFIFISAIYGLRRAYRLSPHVAHLFFGIALLYSAYFSITMSPLPYSVQRDLYVFSPQKNAKDAREWEYRLQDDSIPVAATGNVGTFLSSRRKFYYFSQYYDLADYVIIRPSEIFTYHDKETLIPVYQKLVRDLRYVLIDKRENFEVYKRL